MRSTLRRWSFLAFVILIGGLVSAYPQMCGRWTVSIELVDGSDRPIENATVSFVEVPEGDAATKRPFKRLETAQNIYVATFIEGDKVSKEYKLLINAPGYLDFTATTKIDYCRKTAEKIVLVRSTTLTGTIFDTNGAIVPGAKIKAVSRNERQSIAQTNDSGAFVLELISGSYQLEFNSPGFKTYVINDYLIKDAPSGKMNLDIVLTGETDHEPCGYGGDCSSGEEIKIEEAILQDNVGLRPIIEVPKKAKTQYCLAVTDEFGASIPKANVRLSPTKQSRSKVKYQFMTDEKGSINVEVIDGVYEITIEALTYKKMVLKQQLLPYGPRGCVEVRLRSAIPPHQIT